ETAEAPKLPSAAQLASYVGSYDLSGSKLGIVQTGKRIYIDGPGAPRYRLVPISDHEFWIEELQSVAVFEKDANDPMKIARVVFVVGQKQMSAPRVAD